MEGTSLAFTDYALGVDAPEDAVLDFYRQQLPTLGWQLSDSDTITGMNERRVLAWRKGAVVFKVSLLRKHDVGNPPASDQYTTPYTITLVGKYVP